jgi:hypothetical protein
VIRAARRTGIRPTQYTTDITVNPSTYASVADLLNISQPHGIGYVWNTMLWEVYWNLVDRYGLNPDIYGHWSSGGNNLAFQLVMDGMKMQPCRPGFVDGRNAILTADTALTGGANYCEICAACRGLLSANQGSSNNRLDGAGLRPAGGVTSDFGGFEALIDAAPTLNARTRQVIPAVRLEGDRVDRPAVGKRLARADGRGADGDRVAGRDRVEDGAGRRVPRQLADRRRVGGVMPSTDGAPAGGRRRGGVLQL